MTTSILILLCGSQCHENANRKRRTVFFFFCKVGFYVFHKHWNGLHCMNVITMNKWLNILKRKAAAPPPPSLALVSVGCDWIQAYLWHDSRVLQNNNKNNSVVTVPVGTFQGFFNYSNFSTFFPTIPTLYDNFLLLRYKHIQYLFFKATFNPTVVGEIPQLTIFFLLYLTNDGQ